MTRLRRASLLLALAAGTLIVGTSAAGAATFSNTTAITIPAGGPANATPYPSPIAVSGLSGTVSDVNVTLTDYSSGNPGGQGALLVGPAGQAFKLMDGVGDFTDAIDLNFTLDDSAAGFLPDTGALMSGTYKPTSYMAGSSFPAPGPGTTYGEPGPSGAATFASSFNGASPNGTWNLFVRNLAAGAGGGFGGGWTLEVSTVVPAVPPQLLPATQTPPAKRKCKKRKGKKSSDAAASRRCKKKKRG